MVLLIALSLILPGIWKKLEPKAALLSFQITGALLRPLSPLSKVEKFLEAGRELKRQGRLGDPALFWSFAGSYYRYFFLLAEIILALRILKTDPGKRFSRRLDMWSLVETNARKFPCLRPLLKTGPVTRMSPVSGPWALGQTPALFASLNGILGFEKGGRYQPEDFLHPESGLAILDAPILERTNLFNAGRAALAFARQLGPRFHGKISDLPPHLRALALAFVCHHLNLKDLAFKILDELSTSWEPEKNTVKLENLAELEERFADFTHPELELHRSYQNVYFMALLRLARKKGSLPSSLWLWLKPVDRRLFYCLNQVGGRAAWAEGAGAWSHFITERKAGRPLSDPVMAPAARALEASLVTEGYLDEDHEREIKVMDVGETGSRHDPEKDQDRRRLLGVHDSKEGVKRFPFIPRVLGRATLKNGDASDDYRIREEVERSLEEVLRRLDGRKEKTALDSPASAESENAPPIDGARKEASTPFGDEAGMAREDLFNILEEEYLSRDEIFENDDQADLEKERADDLERELELRYREEEEYWREKDDRAGTKGVPPPAPDSPEEAETDFRLQGNKTARGNVPKDGSGDGGLYEKEAKRNQNAKSPRKEAFDSGEADEKELEGSSKEKKSGSFPG
jgi:hypothetical protein